MGGSRVSGNPPLADHKKKEQGKEKKERGKDRKDLCKKMLLYKNPDRHPPPLPHSGYIYNNNAIN
jgi:hypothetical protein